MISFLFTSVYCYASEGALAVFFLAGLWYVSRRVITPVIRRLFPGINVTDDTLKRFACFQVLFMAAWSVLFKILLPPFFHMKTGPLFTGGSQYYATAAEFFGTIFAMIALTRGLMKINSFFRVLWNREEGKNEQREGTCA